jgi:hypothetical protein
MFYVALYIKFVVPSPDLTATSHFLSNFSIIPLLNPNTPYTDSPNASYVEQAMTGMLLGDGVLVKKYKGGGTYFKFAQGKIHLDYLNHVFSLFKKLGVVLMSTPSQGQSNVKGSVHTWYQFSTQSLSCWNDLQALWYVNGVKVVPKNIFDLLTPISLAYCNTLFKYLNLSLSILVGVCTSILFIFIINNLIFMVPNSLVCESSLCSFTSLLASHSCPRSYN